MNRGNNVPVTYQSAGFIHIYPSINELYGVDSALFCGVHTGEVGHVQQYGSAKGRHRMKHKDSQITDHRPY